VSAEPYGMKVLAKIGQLAIQTTEERGIEMWSDLC
jgi:hypothetical protein